MGNIFAKDCTDMKKTKKIPEKVGWKLPSGGHAESTNDPVKGKLNPKDFIFARKNTEVLVREPGSIGGQQFIVEECSGCEVYLLDHTAALTIDVCTDCRIFAGPCESSVFIRDCKNCTVVVACQQFRTRDCSGCTFFLFTATQPIIESSVDLRFGCYTLDYFSLAGQFAAANLSVWNNKWSQIFNFTGGERDWSCLPPGSHHRGFTTNSLPEAARQRVGYTDHTNGAVVPLTAGTRGLAPGEETCFVIVMPGHIDAVLGKVLAVGGGADSLTSVKTSRLLRTKLFRPQVAQSKPFFDGAPASVISLASSYPVLGLQWAGPGSQEAAISLLKAAGVNVNVPGTIRPPPQQQQQQQQQQGVDVDVEEQPSSATTTVVGVNGAGGTGVFNNSENSNNDKENVGGGAGAGGKGKGIATTEFYLAGGSAASLAKAQVFFEQWEEDKGMPLVGSAG